MNVRSLNSVRTGRQSGMLPLVRSSGMLVITALILLCSSGNRIPAQNSEDKLVNFLHSLKLSEGRLLGFPYVTRGESLGVRGQLKALRQSAAKASRSLTGEDVVSLHSLALLRLANRDVESAISLLERATIVSPVDLGVLNDLSVVYLEKANTRPGSFYLLRALSTLDRASKLYPSNLEIAFNRAVVLERLSLSVQSQLAWRHYLSLDPGSKWSKDAREHISFTDHQGGVKINTKRFLESAILIGDYNSLTQVVMADVQAGRVYAENDLLQAAAMHSCSGNLGGETQELTAANSIGNVLLRITGDRFVHDSVRALRKRQCSYAIREAYRNYAEALLYYNSRNIVKAASAFQLARARSREGNSPLALWTRF